MSAIAGIFTMQPHNQNPELGPHLMRQLQRYPADTSGLWQEEGILLGCHNQWMTAESRGETLPFHDPQRQLAVTADAILDNRPELCRELNIPLPDHQAITDSQLILLAYDKWGEAAPAHLIGDFSFLIWDGKRRSLFGARDFSGNRTLYFHRSADMVAFCTAMHPLLHLPGVDHALNEAWIAEFLAIPVRVDAADCTSTVYRSIEQLPPSHSITVEAGTIRFSRYCTLNTPPKLRLATNGEYEEAFREVFGRAVRDRLRTHHAAGANLSGGLDSGSVVSFAAAEMRDRQKPLHTFSSYPLDSFTPYPLGNRVADERPYIEATIRHVGNIEPSFLNFPDRSPYSDIDDWLDIMEMPYKFIENSYWLKGIYEQAQAKGIGIILSGQRGNWSISWGPALDYQAKLLREFRWLSLYRENRLYSREMNASRKKTLRTALGKAFPALGARKAAEPQPELIHPDFARRSGVYERLGAQGLDLSAGASSIYEVRRRHFAEPHIWNVNGTVATKLSLKYRVWDRDPTNDLRVIRFCLSVPEEQYVQDGMDRSLIRRAMAGRLPDDVRLNRKRRGVQGADGIVRMLPEWPRFLAEAGEMLRDVRAAGYLNQTALEVCLDKLGREPAPQQIFSAEFRLLARGLVFYRFLKRFS